MEIEKNFSFGKSDSCLVTRALDNVLRHTDKTDFMPLMAYARGNEFYTTGKGIFFYGRHHRNNTCGFYNNCNKESWQITESFYMHVPI